MHNKGTTFVPTNYPTYRGWSDMLLRERQHYDTNKKSFGEGEIVKFCDVIVIRKYFLGLLNKRYYRVISVRSFNVFN